MNTTLSIGRRVSLLSIAIILIIGFLASALVYFQVSSESLSEKKDKLLALVSQQAGEVDGLFMTAEDLVRVVADSVTVKEYLADPKAERSEEISQFLERFNVRQNFASIYLLTATGSAVASTDRTFIGNNYSFRNYFQEGVSGILGRDMAIGVTSKEPGFYFSYPIRDSNEKIIGVAVIKVKSLVVESTAKATEVGRLGQSLLVDSDGVVLFSSRPDWLFKTLGPIEPARMEEIRAERKFEGVELAPLAYEQILTAMANYRQPVILTVYDRLEQRTELIGLAQVGRSGYFFILESGLADIARQSVMLSLWVAGIVLLTVVTTAFMTLLMSRRFVNEINRAYTELEKFKLAVDQSSSHIIITDPDAKIIYANPAAEKTTGFKVEEIIGQNPRLWGGLMGKEFYQNMWRTIKTERKSFRAEVKNKRKNGEIYTVMMTISPIIGKKGELVGFVGLEDDISSRIKAEDALRRSEERFKALVEKSSDVISLLDAEGRILYESPGVIRVLGRTPEEMIGHSAFEFTHPDENERLKKLFERLITNPDESMTAQFRFKHADGSWRWIEAVGTNALSLPSIKAIIVNFRDITERKTAADALLEANAKNEAILSSIGDGVVVVGNDGRVLLVNKTAERLLGWKAGELLGRIYSDSWYIKDSLGNIVTSNRPLQAALSGETVSTSEHYLTRKDGSDFLAYITTAPVSLSGRVVGAIMSFHDISAEKAVDRAKTEFVSLASHQLRTPLSAVNWYAEMLLAGDVGAVDPRQKKYLEEIYESNKRMVELVNALLNVSRIDLGTFAIEPENVNVIDLAKSVVTELRPQIVFKKLLVTENYDPNLPIFQADPKLIRIIVQNLMTNAVKYTAVGGRASLDIKIVKSGEVVGGRTVDKDSVLIQVADNGYGIPADAKEKIFTKLFRADNVKEKETEGTGLGLYIVKSIVDASGGAIWFDSVEGQGSTFYVLLPLSGMPKREGTKQLSYDVFSRISAS